MVAAEITSDRQFPRLRPRSPAPSPARRPALYGVYPVTSPPRLHARSQRHCQDQCQHRRGVRSMPYIPTNPQPPLAEPGKNRPDDETRKPGSYRPERDADPEPPEDDDPIEPL